MGYHMSKANMHSVRPSNTGGTQVFPHKQNHETWKLTTLLSSNRLYVSHCVFGSAISDKSERTWKREHALPASLRLGIQKHQAKHSTPRCCETGSTWSEYTGSKTGRQIKRTCLSSWSLGGLRWWVLVVAWCIFRKPRRTSHKNWRQISWTFWMELIRSIYDCTLLSSHTWNNQKWCFKLCLLTNHTPVKASENFAGAAMFMCNSMTLTRLTMALNDVVTLSMVHDAIRWKCLDTEWTREIYVCTQALMNVTQVTSDQWMRMWWPSLMIWSSTEPTSPHRVG